MICCYLAAKLSLFHQSTFFLDQTLQFEPPDMDHESTLAVTDLQHRVDRLLRLSLISGLVWFFGIGSLLSILLALQAKHVIHRGNRLFVQHPRKTRYSLKSTPAVLHGELRLRLCLGIGAMGVAISLWCLAHFKTL